MLDLSFFKNPRFSAANSAITLTFFALFGTMFLLTQYWQFVHGYTPLEAGVRMLPFAAVMMITAPLSAHFVERLGTKAIVTAGLLVVAAGMLGLSFIGTETAYVRVIVVYCFVALGMRLVMAPATESVMGSLPREKAGVGSAVNDTTRQVGGALGVAVIGSIVASVYSAHITDAAPAVGLTGSALTKAQGSLGGALHESAAGLGDEAGAFVRRRQGRVRRGAVERAAHRRVGHRGGGGHRLRLPAGGRRRPNRSCSPPPTYLPRTGMPPPSRTDPASPASSASSAPASAEVVAPRARAGHATSAPTGPSWRRHSSWPAPSASVRSPWTPSPLEPA